MAERLELARPMVRGCAGLDPHDTRRQLLEERWDLAALKLTADDHVPRRVDAVDLRCNVNKPLANREPSISRTSLQLLI
jgi:hypothetical protein